VAIPQPETVKPEEQTTMRMTIINQSSDLKTLGARLFGTDTALESALAGLQRLNPHVDFSRMEAGTVILVPEQAGLRDGESASVSGSAFQSFESEVRAGVKGIAARVSSGRKSRLAQQEDFSTLLELEGVKNLFDNDAELKTELEVALQTFKNDQQATKESESLLKVLQEQSTRELAGLGKLMS
jgi:hypothetical protein